MRLAAALHDAKACAERPSEWWYPDERSIDAARAKAICRSCPVRFECLEASLDPTLPELYGIWGGLDESDRRRIMAGRREAGRVDPGQVPAGGTARRVYDAVAAHDGEITCAEISQATGVPRQSVNAALARLRIAGHVHPSRRPKTNTLYWTALTASDDTVAQAG